MDTITTERIEDIDRARNLAEQEARIRALFSSKIEYEESKISRIAQFLTDFGDSTSNWRWGNEGTPKQIEAVGQLVADLAVIAEREGLNSHFIHHIFRISELFQPFFMFPRDIRFAKELATEKINEAFPESNFNAYDLMDNVFEYLDLNRPEQ